MSVIPLTVFFSLGLVFVFVALFWREQRHSRSASAERDSLLPLADESPRSVVPSVRLHATHDDGHVHAHEPVHHQGEDAPDGHRHGADRCGCERGERPPCAGCHHQAMQAASPVL